MKKTAKVLFLLILNFGIFTILIAQNNCLDFDGTDDYVNCGNGTNFNITTAITIEAWAKISGGSTTYPRIVSKAWQGPYELTVKLETHILQLVLHDNGGSAHYCEGTTNIDDNNWHHLAGTWDGTVMHVYVDGILDDAYPSSFSGTLKTNTTNVNIGKQSGGSDAYLDGTLDEVRIWNDARTVTEIRANMYRELTNPTGEANLIAYYKFNETTGTTADNAEGTAAYDGTLTGTDFNFANSGGQSGAFTRPMNCLSFDGVNEYIDIGTGPTTVQSVEFWVYPTTTTEYFIDLNGSAYISSGSGTISATGFTSPTIYVDGIESSTIVSGKWQHIAVTTGTNISASDLDIGRLEGQEEFDGKIDEVRLWSDVRIATEIRANMYKELAGTETGLVAYYKLNETTGTTADNAEGTAAYDGTLTGTDFTFANSGKPSGAFSGPGNCLSFDGVDEYIDIGTGPTTVQSVEFWVYPTTTTEYFIDLNGSAYISSGSGTISATGFTSPTIYVDGIVSSTIVSGKWQHIAVTTGTSINTSDLDIGRLEGQEEFDGKIDEVRLWSDVRTATEIRDNMCRTLDGGESGLIAYYRFDHKNTSGQTTLYDITSNENHGTLTNMEANADWVDCEAFTTWIGSEGTSWAAASNWSDGVPTSIDNVGIPNYSGGSQPTISSAAACNNLIVGNDATLTFNCTGSHTIHGSAFVIGHSDINNGSFLTITKNLYILFLSTLDVDPGGQLTIGNKLDIWTSGTCTVKSNATGTGSLIVNGTATGDVTVERFLTHGKWHYIAEPINTSGNFST
ncbi:MAG: LamG domain-containing protein, partial [Bacteroidales bacterium]|nr:LamG domain-containing protein [Bacteroidales bacterium]